MVKNFIKSGNRLGKGEMAVFTFKCFWKKVCDSNECFRDTIFVTTSGATIRPNVAPIVFELEQATYVLGHTAARISKTGRVGAVGGIEIPSVASTFYAFEAGARAAGRPDLKVSISYIGSWTDVAAAHEATRAQIDTGVDVLIHNANEAARGFFQAVRESSRSSRGSRIWAFGSNRNQNDLAPAHTLASATLRVPRALLLVAEEVRDGRFTPRSIRFGLRDGVVGIEWNAELVATLSPDVRTQADALMRRIEAGELTVPRLDF